MLSNYNRRYEESILSEAPPPEYDVGTQVKVAPKSPESTVVIKVDQGAGNKFDRGTALTGQIVITPKRDMHIEVVLVDFQQVVMLTRRQLYSNSTTTNAVSIANYLIPAGAYPRDKVLKRGWEYSFTFSIVIPNSFIDSDCPHSLPLHRQLPPTVGSPFYWCDQCDDVPDKSVVIAYRLRARVIKAGDHFAREPCLYKQYKYIRLAPCYTPLQLPPRPVVSTWELKHGKIKRAAHGKLTLRIPKPPILYLTHRAANLSVALSTNVSYDQLPKLKQVLYKITAYTSSTSIPLSYYPDLNDPHCHCVKDSLGLMRTSAKFSRFEHANGEYNSFVNFAISLPVEKGGIVPSYFACLSSRLYELTIFIEFHNYQTVSCTTPLIIGQDHHSSKWLREDEGDPVPPYDPTNDAESDRYVRLGNWRNLDTAGFEVPKEY